MGMRVYGLLATLWLLSGCAAAAAPATGPTSPAAFAVQAVGTAEGPRPGLDDWITAPVYQKPASTPIVGTAAREAARLLGAPGRLGTPVTLTPQRAAVRFRWESFGVYLRGTMTAGGVTRPVEALLGYAMGRWRLIWLRGAPPQSP
jgi:hypothetical protein